MPVVLKRPSDAVIWWEKRRPLFNLALLPVGLATVLVIEAVGERLFPPGEDAIEPIAVLIGVVGYAIAANACYTLGWITELLWSGGDTTHTALRRPRVFRIGLLFSVALTFLPAIAIPALWAIFRAS